MFTKVFSYGGVLLLAGAAVLATPAFGRAQFRGGPRFGGMPFGGARFGGAYFGGFRGGFYHNPGAFYRNPGYYGGHRYGHYGYGYHPYYGYRYYPYYDGYAAYLSYYGGYGSSEPSYGAFYTSSFVDYGSALNAPARRALTAEEMDVRALLAASGVPADEDRPVWPLALRLLPGREAEALRGQIDGLLQVAATQAARGRPNPAVVEELAQTTDHLRKLLHRHRQERPGLTQPAYQEGERFLDKLGDAPRLLRIQPAPAPAGSGGEGKGGSHAPDHRP
jgi:hypothetical protein